MDDEDFKQIFSFNNLIMDSLGLGDPAASIPWLRFFPSKDISNLKQGIAMRDKLLSKKVNERIETYDPDVVRDFVDSLIKTSGDESLFKDMGSEGIERGNNLDLLLSNMLLAGNWFFSSL